jgi:long-chain acyl-CoA synthetase
MPTDLRVSPPRLLAIFARHRPDWRAVVTPFGSRSYKALHENTNRLANHFVAAGLEVGDRLLLLCANRPEFVEVMVAGDRAGVSIIPLVHDLKPPELRHVIRDSAAQAFLVDASLEHSVAAVVDEVTATKLRLAVAGSLHGFERYDDALAAASPDSTPRRARGFPIYYTSGTTGRPKAVRTRPDLSPLTPVLPQIYDFRQGEDSLLCPFPLFQPGVFNLAVATPLACGATVHLLAEARVGPILETIAREKISHAHLSPYVFHLMRAMGEEQLARYDLSSLRCVIHGGAPCPVDLKHWVMSRLGPIVTEYYAASEGGGTWITGTEWLGKPGSVGKPLPELDVRIIDEAGNVCPAGTTGLVYFKSPRDFRFEYLGDRAKTEAAYRGDHFTVRDIGYLDEDGYLFLVGRDADIANVNEDNVYPEEIDQALEDHPGVAEALTFSIPAEDKGEKIVSLVRPRVPDDVGDDLRKMLFEHCERNLARYKWPAVIEIVDTLPRSVIGKKQRYRARQLFLDRAAPPRREEHRGSDSTVVGE